MECNSVIIYVSLLFYQYFVSDGMNNIEVRKVVQNETSTLRIWRRVEFYSDGSWKMWKLYASRVSTTFRIELIRPVNFWRCYIIIIVVNAACVVYLHFFFWNFRFVDSKISISWWSSDTSVAIHNMYAYDVTTTIYYLPHIIFMYTWMNYAMITFVLQLCSV